MVELGPIVAGFGSNPEPGFGLVAASDSQLVVGVSDTQDSAIVITEDLAPPESQHLVVEVVQEPVRGAVPRRILWSPVGAKVGGLLIDDEITLERFGELVGPLVGQS